MTSTQNFDICFFGTPHGFEQTTLNGGFSLDLIRILEFDITTISPTLGEKFIRVVERTIAGDFYRFICIYTSALEKDSSRPGGYCGVSIIFKNTNSPDPITTINVLNELINSLYSTGTNGGRFVNSISNIFRSLPIPNDLKILTGNLSKSISPSYQKISTSTILITAGDGMVFPNLAYALNFLNTSYICSRFADVCIVPVNLAGKLASKINNEFVDLLTALKLTSNFDLKINNEIVDLRSKNNIANNDLISLKKNLDANLIKIKDMELQISSYQRSAFFTSTPQTDTNLKPTDAEVGKTHDSKIKIASPVKVNAPNDRSFSKVNDKNTLNKNVNNDDGLFSFLLKYFILPALCFISIVIVVLYLSMSGVVESYYNKINNLFITDKSYKKNEGKELAVNDDKLSNYQQSIIEKQNQKQAQLNKQVCDVEMSKQKNSYIFTSDVPTTDGLSDVANLIALEFCAPLSGCQSNLIQSMKSLNPDLIEPKNLLNKEIKVDIISDCDIQDRKFKLINPKSARKK